MRIISEWLWNIYAERKLIIRIHFFFEQMEKGDPYGNVARIIGKEKIGFFHIDSI